MKKWMSLLAIYIVCSTDGGLTRTIFENVHHAFFKQNCLVFEADAIDGPAAACEPETECVIREGTVPPAGEYKGEYFTQESTETVK